MKILICLTNIANLDDNKKKLGSPSKNLGSRKSDFLHSINVFFNSRRCAHEVFGGLLTTGSSGISIVGVKDGTKKRRYSRWRNNRGHRTSTHLLPDKNK